MHQQRWRVFWIRNEYTLDYQITQDFASTFSQFKQTLKLALIQKAYNHLEHANIFMHNALGIRYVFMFLCLYSLPSQTMMRIEVSTYICNVTSRSKAVVIFHPKPTCIQAKTCGECSEMATSTPFDCVWCNHINRCSDGKTSFILKVLLWLFQ